MRKKSPDKYGTRVENALRRAGASERELRRCVLLEYDGERDDLGRCKFSLSWYDGGSGWRGQVFHAVPEEYIRRWLERGRRVLEAAAI